APMPLSPPDRSSSVPRSLRTPLALLAGTLLLALAASVARPAAPPSAARMAKLKERDRLWQEMRRLHQAGKVAEALAACRRLLSLERSLYGKDSAGVDNALGWLAGLHEAREDWPQALQARAEVEALRQRPHGKDHWRVTDARLERADTQLRSRLT